MRSNTCPKCQGSMAEGFVAHERHGGIPTVDTWFRGAPVRGWFGVKLPKGGVEIVTWRCQRCGFLENYARS